MIKSQSCGLEDVVLWRVFGSRKSGYYVDVGAGDPCVGSVSASFHSAGWAGLEVEGSRKWCVQLEKCRPLDQVINAVVGPFSGLANIQERPDHESDYTSAPAENLTDQSHGSVVPQVTIDDIFERVVAPDVDWIRIRLRQNVLETIRGWKASILRPSVLLLSISPKCKCSDIDLKEIDEFLSLKGYVPCTTDGVNTFYGLSILGTSTLGLLKYAPNETDHYQLGAGAPAVADLAAQHAIEVSSLKDEVRALEAALESSKFAAIEMKDSFERQWTEQEASLKHSLACESREQTEGLRSLLNSVSGERDQLLERIHLLETRESERELLHERRENEWKGEASSLRRELHALNEENSSQTKKIYSLEAELERYAAAEMQRSVVQRRHFEDLLDQERSQARRAWEEKCDQHSHVESSLRAVIARAEGELHEAKRSSEIALEVMQQRHLSTMDELRGQAETARNDLIGQIATASSALHAAERSASAKIAELGTQLATVRLELARADAEKAALRDREATLAKEKDEFVSLLNARASRAAAEVEAIRAEYEHARSLLVSERDTLMTEVRQQGERVEALIAEARKKDEDILAANELTSDMERKFDASAEYVNRVEGAQRKLQSYIGEMNHALTKLLELGQQTKTVPSLFGSRKAHLKLSKAVAEAVELFPKMRFDFTEDLKSSNGAMPQYQVIAENSVTVRGSEMRTIPSTITELLQLETDAFIHWSYKLLLGREPDRLGAQHYALKLWEGEGRTRIIHEIASSKEYQQAGKKIPGLDALLKRLNKRPTWIDKLEAMLESKRAANISLELLISGRGGSTSAEQAQHELRARAESHSGQSALTASRMTSGDHDPQPDIRGRDLHTTESAAKTPERKTVSVNRLLGARAAHMSPLERIAAVRSRNSNQ